MTDRENNKDRWKEPVIVLVYIVADPEHKRAVLVTQREFTRQEKGGTWPGQHWVPRSKILERTALPGEKNRNSQPLERWRVPRWIATNEGLEYEEVEES